MNKYERIQMTVNEISKDKRTKLRMQYERTRMRIKFFFSSQDRSTDMELNNFLLCRQDYRHQVKPVPKVKLKMYALG